MKEIAVYTAIFGKYDKAKLFDPSFINDADFYLFTDNKTKYSDDLYNVQTREILQGYKKPLSRMYKILSHVVFPEYDYTIWLDGSVELLVSPKLLIDKYLKDHDIAVSKHPQRDCIYAEAVIAVAFLGTNKYFVDDNIAFLRKEGFPEHFGLSENGVVIRRNCNKINELNELWWNTYSMFYTRDQLSFDYCKWKLDIKSRDLDGYFYTRPLMTEFKYHGHG